MMGARPQAIGYGMTDSPAGLAAFMLVHPGFAAWSYGKNAKQGPTKDEVLDNFSLYWLTSSLASSARLRRPEQRRRCAARVSSAAGRTRPQGIAPWRHVASRYCCSSRRLRMPPIGVPVGGFHLRIRARVAGSSRFREASQHVAVAGAAQHRGTARQLLVGGARRGNVRLGPGGRSRKKERGNQARAEQ